jgi:hypothetical protein
MSNFTAVNKMTGVGNALKKHYQMYLTEYEKVWFLGPPPISKSLPSNQARLTIT